MFFFFKQKTAYEMRISDWSSDVCSSDLFVTSSELWAFGIQQIHLDQRTIQLAHHRPFPLPSLCRDARKDDLVGQFWCFCVELVPLFQIGRASCRERVCQYV